MKAYRDLYPRVCDFENLYLAYRRARKGKRGRPEVAAFEFHLEEELVRLQDALVAKTYRHGAYRSFTIHEPKVRLISAAPFRDRVVHHALMGAIQPAFERAYIRDSYANRPGRGTHSALDRAQAFAVVSPLRWAKVSDRAPGNWQPQPRSETSPNMSCSVSLLGEACLGRGLRPSPRQPIG